MAINWQLIAEIEAATPEHPYHISQGLLDDVCLLRPRDPKMYAYVQNQLKSGAFILES